MSPDSLQADTDWIVLMPSLGRKPFCALETESCYEVLHRHPRNDSKEVEWHNTAQQFLQKVDSGYLSLLGSASQKSLTTVIVPT